jgi:hypothetical protein
MRGPPSLAILALVAGVMAHSIPAQAQMREVPVCPSRDEAQLAMQRAPDAALPQGCRMAMVRRLDTSAGPVCSIELRQQEGVVAAVREAMTTTEWWTACANLRAP